MNKLIIYQYWFCRYNNIGDLLGPWIVKRISGQEIRYATYVTKMEAIRIVVGSLLRLKLPEKEYFRRLFIGGSILFAVGSILDHCNEDTVVWGSGFQNKGETCRNSKFLAVRGPESLKRLQELGYDVPDNLPIGDPALLMPILYKPNVDKKYELGIVMHDSDREYIQKHFSHFHLIDVATNQVEAFMDDICSCKRILTTSMHGLILAHAYGIPALWVQKNWIGSDGFKFADYFGSVEIPFYSPIQVTELQKMNKEELLQMVDDNESSLPYISLTEIQSRLLNSFSYKIGSNLSR